jgi:hypothetical protein
VFMPMPSLSRIEENCKILDPSNTQILHR